MGWMTLDSSEGVYAVYWINSHAPTSCSRSEGMVRAAVSYIARLPEGVIVYQLLLYLFRQKLIKLD